MADYTPFIQENLHHLQGADAFLPAHNSTFGNPNFAAASCRVLIARLSPWRDVDRSLPHLFLFQEVRRALPRAYVDLAFFPSRIDLSLYEVNGIPPLLGVHSLHSIEEFDLVLLTNAYTLELINLPYLLLRSGLPLWSSQRGEEGPILILGGSNAMASQAIVHADGDCLVDGIFVGEGEGRVGKLVSILAGHWPPPWPPPQPSPDAPQGWRSGEGEEGARPCGRASSSPPYRPSSVGFVRGGLRGGLLAYAAEQVEGFWAAGSPSPTVKATCDTPQATHLPVDYPADEGRPLLNTTEAHTAHLQINYGCPAFCSFCFEAYDRKPYREIPLLDLLEAARRIKQAQSSEELNLYSFNFNTHADILALLPALHRLYDRVGATSQRVDILQHSPHLLETELEAGKRSYTLGIEGISARQRAFLHKSLPTADILGLLGRLASVPIREIKLFYILTGHENEEDIAEFRQFLRDVKALRRTQGRRAARTVFSFGLLIRMPFTPLRYDRLFLEEDHWRPLIGQAKSACETNGFEFRLAFDWPAYCTTQVLAMGGHWLAEAVVALAREGLYFDTELPEGYWERLRAWMEREGQWKEALMGEKGPDYPFALDWLRSNVPPEFLYQQYQEAREGVDRGYCLGRAEEPGRCLACGACASPEQRQAIVRHRFRTASEPSALRQTIARKRRLKPAYVRVRIDRRLSGALPAFLNATLFRGLLAHSPGLVENLLSVRESLFTVRPNDRRFPPLTGETVFALRAWDVEAVLDTLRGMASAVTEAGSEERSRGFHTAPGVQPGERAMESAATEAESEERSRGFHTAPGVQPGERAMESAATGGFEVIGPAEGFVPGAYTRIEIELHLPAAHFPEPRARLEAYLRAAYLPYSLRREPPQGEGEARYRFDVPAKGLRKKILFGGAFEVGARGMDARLEIGPGFDVLAFLESWGERGLYRQARVHVTRIEW